MIFQEPMTSLNPVFTIGYQIEESLILHKGMDKKQARERAIELLELVAFSTISPAYMTATSSAISAITPRSWVMIIIDISSFLD